MKRVCAGILFLLMFSANGAEDKQTVLLAAHRAGRVEVFDPVTLAPIGSINVLPLADGIASNPDGKFLYIPEGIAPDFNGCCALYALELETRKMTRLVAPTTRATVSPDGRYLVTQRGNVEIDVFDARTLAQESPVRRSLAPGLYGLSFSPDARLLFGVTNSPQPSLDIFDVGRRQLVRRYSVSDGTSLLGSWVRDDFYLYSYHGADGQIWKHSVAAHLDPFPRSRCFKRLLSLRMFWLMDARSHFGVLEDFAAACQPRSLSSRFVLMFRPAMTWPPKFVLLRFIELCKPEV